MKPQIFLALAALVFTAQFARADEHADKRDSSITPVFDEVLRSIDLRDTLCSPVAENQRAYDKDILARTVEFKTSLKALPAFLNSLTHAHWYFGNVVSRRLTSKVLCLTDDSTLAGLPASELNYLSGYQVADAIGLIAFADSAAIYLSPRFKELPAQEQARLWVKLNLWGASTLNRLSDHLAVERRRLGDLFAFLRENEAELVSTPEQIEKALTDAGFTPGAELEALDPLRKMLEIALNPSGDLDIRQQTARALMKTASAFASHLNDGDFHTINSLNDQLRTRMSEATRKGDTAAYRRALELGAAPDGEDAYHGGAVLVRNAIFAKKPELALEILAHPKVVLGYHAPDAMVEAINAGYTEVALKLLDHKNALSPEWYDALRALISAIRKKQTAVAVKMIKHSELGGYLDQGVYDTGNYRTETYEIPIITAAETGDLEVLNALLESKASANSSTERRIKIGPHERNASVSALYFAAKSGNLPMVQRLLKVSDIVVTKEALGVAVINRDHAIVSALLDKFMTQKDKGQNWEIAQMSFAIEYFSPDFPGGTSTTRPIAYAMKHNDLELLALLLKPIRELSGSAHYSDQGEVADAILHRQDKAAKMMAATPQVNLRDLTYLGAHSESDPTGIAWFSSWSLLGLAIARGNLDLVKAIVTPERFTPEELDMAVAHRKTVGKKTTDFSPVALAKAMKHKEIADWLDKYVSQKKSFCILGWCPF